MSYRAAEKSVKEVLSVIDSSLTMTITVFLLEKMMELVLWKLEMYIMLILSRKQSKHECVVCINS